MFYLGTRRSDHAAEPVFVVVVVRGDLQVNERAIQAAGGFAALRPAGAAESSAHGIVPGYGSPLGAGTVFVIADATVAGENASRGWVTGANEHGYHAVDVVPGRDFPVDAVANVAAVADGAPCIRCGHPLRFARGVEVANIFQLGTRYSEALSALYRDRNGDSVPLVMGSYGIGLGRLLACVAEEHHDERGLSFPMSVAPYAVSLVSLAKSAEHVEIAEGLYGALQRAGISVLFDDRTGVSAGVKFADSDLRGMPIRVTVSERTLQSDEIEIVMRADPQRDSRRVAIAGAVDELRRLIGEQAGAAQPVVTAV